MRKLGAILAALVLGLAIGALIMAGVRVGGLFGRGPDPETVAAASLQSMREQAKLTPFVARFVAVVTSRQQRFGLTARKTMIMPGTVRYELDLAQIQAEDLDWDAAERRLSVTIPPLEISQPQVDLSELQEYGSGGILGRITNAEDRLDAANRERGEQELMRQARQPMPMRLARDAARRAVQRSFSMPLKATGIDAEVEVAFSDEPGQDPSYLDRSRRMEDVIRERREQAN